MIEWPARLLHQHFLVRAQPQVLFTSPLSTPPHGAVPQYVSALLSRQHRLARHVDTRSASTAQRPANAHILRPAPGKHVVLTTVVPKSENNESDALSHGDSTAGCARPIKKKVPTVCAHADVAAYFPEGTPSDRLSASYTVKLTAMAGAVLKKVSESPR